MNSYFEKMLCQIIEDKSDLDIDFEQYPKELYRYRPCNDNNFDSLENDYLWISYPSDYKDPFDSFVHIDKIELANAFEETLVNHIPELFYFFIFSRNIEIFQPNITLEEIEDFYRSLILYSSGKYDKELTIKNIESYYYKLPIEQQEVLQVSFKKLFAPENFDKIKNSFEAFVLDTANTARENYMTCSLTKRKDNRNMWENYAENYTGFVVEYTLDRNNRYSPFMRYLFEVTYVNDISPLDLKYLLNISFGATFYNEEINLVEALLPMVKRALIKSNDYRSEEEWRFITRKLIGNKVEFPFASAVYAGYKISDDNLKRLQEICERKNISLYMQKLDSIGGRLIYDLVV